MKITVFGGTAAAPASAPYEEARRLGRLLAQHGHMVISGGYMGVMEAVSRGAAEAGGHVVGVTCAEIERWRGSKANPWVLEEWKTETLMDRLVLLMDRCDAAIALAGGPGTLVEISLLWNRMIIDAVPHKPLILSGDGWKSAFEALFSAQDSYLGEPQRRLLAFVPSVEAAVASLPQA